MPIAPHILVLAAGRGSRMRSSRPKVLHRALFRPMLHYVLDAARSLPHRSISVVVGHAEAEVREACRGYDVRYFKQESQLGTAHAVRAAEPYLCSQEGDLLVLSGDVPLVGRATLERLLERHEDARAAATVATFKVADPSGYGRLIRDGGRIAGIREEADCSPDERRIDEVNGGVYCFGIRALFQALALVGNRNGQGEYYLPDVIRLLAAAGATVADAPVEDPNELQGVNDMAALAEAEAVLRRRVNRAFMLQGVRLEDPETTSIDPGCRIGKDVEIEAGVILDACELGDGVVVERGCRLSRAIVGDGTRVKQGSRLDEAVVGPRCQVGPYAHLRPGSRLEEEVRIGNFVELKKAVLGAGTKASHLAYIGDADIGRNVNVGCGFITCNYAGGGRKNKTVVEDEVFIGSDCQAVAPVRLGAGSYVAAGTTITEDSPAESLVISRGRQTTKPGYAKKYRQPRAPKTREARESAS